MTQDSDDAARVAPDAPHAAPAGPPVYPWNLGRFIAAVGMLVGAALTPWNLFFGVGIPGSSRAWFVVLLSVTALAIASVAAGHSRNPAVRIALCIPYALFVLAVVVFDLFETLKYGGDPGAPGVGPGVWLGAAGAALAAQPVLTGDPQDDIDRRRPWLAAARVVGIGSVVLAALSVGFTLYWQTSQAIPGLGRAGLFGRSVATIATFAVYDAAALAPVVVGSGWIVQRNKGARLATVALGISTVAAGLLVWLTRVGRDIDVYHGIAQITSQTPSVGFEGYLVWTVAAAVFAPLTLRAVVSQKPIDGHTWRQAARKGLLLVAVGSAGVAAMRLADLVVAVSFDTHQPIFGGLVLIVVNAATAGLAWWLRRDTAGPLLAYAILVLGSIARVVAALVLAPRQPGLSAAAAAQPVYGNALSQQFTSTFDIVLCFMAAAVAAMAVVATRGAARPATADVFDAIRAVQPSATDPQPATNETTTVAPQAVPAPVTTDDAGAVSADPDAPAGKHVVDAVLHASTQRFGAGTVYTGHGATTNSGHDGGG